VLVPVTVQFNVHDIIVAPLIVVAVAAHNTGVTNVGLVARTTDQVPVSSEITHANCADVVAANCESGLDVNASHPHAGVAHFNHVTSALSATRDWPSVQTGNLAFAVSNVYKSPFVVKGEVHHVISTFILPVIGLTCTGTVTLESVELTHNIDATLF
jgi:hypothetical protein